MDDSNLELSGRIRPSRWQFLWGRFFVTLGTISAAWFGTCACTAVAQHAGIAEGEKAPSFTLVDQDERKHRLADLTTEGKYVAVVFHRSADW